MKSLIALLAASLLFIAIGCSQGESASSTEVVKELQNQNQKEGTTEIPENLRNENNAMSRGATAGGGGAPATGDRGTEGAKPPAGNTP